MTTSKLLQGYLSYLKHCLVGVFAMFWKDMVSAWAAETKAQRELNRPRNKRFKHDCQVVDRSGKPTGRNLTVSNTVVACLQNIGRLADIRWNDLGVLTKTVKVKGEGRGVWISKTVQIEDKHELILNHWELLASLQRDGWKIAGAFVKDGKGNWLMLMVKHQLFGKLLPEHAKRVQAGILDCNANPFSQEGEVESIDLAIMNMKVHVSAKEFTKEQVKTIDGFGVVRYSALPAKVQKLVPFVMVMSDRFVVPLTTRLVSKHESLDKDGKPLVGRLAKMNLHVCDDLTYMEYAAMLGVKVVANDNKVLTVAKTVKNSVEGETFSAAIAVHKVNCVGSLDDIRTSVNELHTSDYTDLKRVIQAIERNAEGFRSKFGSMEAIVNTISQMGDKEISRMATDEQGETDHALSSTLKSVAAALAAGIPAGLLKKEIELMVAKKASSIMTISEKGVRVTIGAHLGDVVDGERYWIALPKSVTQILPGHLVTGDGVQLNRIELHDRTKSKGWVKVKRSPVMMPFVVPYDKILWLEEGMSCALVCHQFLGLISGDVDGDQVALTWENPVNEVSPEEAMTRRNEASKEMAVILDGLKKSYERNAELNDKEVRAQDFDYFTALVKESGIADAGMRSLYASHLAGDKAGTFSNAGLVLALKLRKAGCSIALVQAILHMSNEGPIQAVKHLDRAEGFLAPHVLRGEGIAAISYRKPVAFIGNEDDGVVGLTDLASAARRLEEVPCFFRPMVQAVASIKWVEVSRDFDSDRAESVVKIEKATRRVVGGMLSKGSMVFNLEDRGGMGENGRWSTGFPSIHTILSNDPAVKAAAIQRWGKSGKYSFPIPFSTRDALGNDLYEVLAKNGDPKDALERMRARDLDTLTKGGEVSVPGSVLCMLLRAWNTTREGSNASFFNSGRMLLQEWKMLAVILLSQE